MILKNKTAIVLIALHLLATIGIFKINNISKKTIILQVVLLILSMLGITGGYHRLWAHTTYKANSILEIFYLIFGTMASQKDVIKWVREHRTHHRNEEKPGDPYNISKGLFHAHVGWLLKPYDMIEINEISKTDITDLEKNKLLVFQRKYYKILWFILSFVVTHYIMKQWNETPTNIFFSNILRIVACLNLTWCINSLAHYIGDKPYNKNIEARNNNILGILTLGEGWHNYHHSYPKDYRTSEPNKFNITTKFINLTSKLGLSKNHYYNNKQKIPIQERFNKNFYSCL